MLVYVRLGHFAVQKLTQHCKSTIINFFLNVGHALTYKQGKALATVIITFIITSCPCILTKLRLRK